MKYIIFKEENKAYNTNNSKYILNYITGEDANAVTHKVPGISLEINDKSYPPSTLNLNLII